MSWRCVYCGSRLASAGHRSEAGGGRLAYDPDRARVWSICDRCHGWSLWPRADRLEALDRLEHLANRRSRLLYQTDNIALLDAGSLELVRVGNARLPEEAWWRYGRELRRRQIAYRSRLSRVGAATYAAVSYLGSNLGFSAITGEFDWEAEPFADILRWRRYGRTAWAGRAPCPNCHSVLLKVFYYAAPSLLLLADEHGRLVVGMPCSRCDPWTSEKVHRFDGRAGERLLRRVLAHRNIAGASPGELRAAVAAIDRAGSPEALIRDLAVSEVPIARVDGARSLALEISVNHDAERRDLTSELDELEARWRYEEELAGIIDGDLG